MTESHFVKQIQDALRQQLEQHELAEANKVRDAKVRETEGPKKWSELRQLISDSVSGINTGLSKPVLAYSGTEKTLPSFTITNQLASRVVEATFDTTSGTISYQGSAGKGSFIATVSKNGLEYLWQTGPVVTIEKMGEVLILSVVSDSASQDDGGSPIR
jgi:hypothetical protein